MELEIFNSSNIRHSRIAGPAIHFNKAGVFTFNKLAIELLNLSKGTTISFVRDKGNPLDWYLMRDSNGMVLRENTAGNLIGNAKMVREMMFESLKSKLKNTTMKFFIAKEPTQYSDKIMYAILTCKPL